METSFDALLGFPEDRAKAAAREAAQRELWKLERALKIEKARESLIDFSELMMPDKAHPENPNLSRYIAKKHHRAIARALEKIVAKKLQFVILCAPPRHGKALHVDTPIATPSGWSRMGDLKVGDFVFDESGSPTLVKAVSPVFKNREIFSVKTDDGDEILADGEHEWLVRLDRKHGARTIRDTKMLAGRSSPRAAMVDAQRGLNLPERELPIDPYVLGAWLGDGNTDDSYITSADAWIVRELSRLEGGHVVQSKKGRTRRVHFGPHYRRGAAKVMTLQARLRSLGVLGNKHIPLNYARASATQRLALLQGLVDTDGYVAADGQIEICSVSRRLADQIKEIVASLGHKASIIEGRATIDGIDKGPKYRIMFYMAGAARLPRKAKKTRHGIRAFRRYITVAPAGRGDTVCIEVEADSHLFLCGRSMLPTHNSQLTTVTLPPFILGKDPYANVIVGCYNDILAKGFGRKIRSYLENPVYGEVFPDTHLVKGGKAVDHMATAQDGMIACVGRGGTTTGRGADYFIVDDPFKDRREARSLTLRNEVWDWYQDVVSTRLMSDTGCIILMMTRWHEDDIIGRLTDPENPHYNEEEAARWSIINLPALAEEDDPLGREVGEPLWPEKFGKEFLESFRRKNPVGFSALYQQRPTPEDGEYFKADMFVTYNSPKDVPGRLKIFAASDHAVKSKQKNDRTCIIVAGVDERGLIWILDIILKRIDTLKQCNEMFAVQEKRRPLRWWAGKDHITGSIGPFLYREMRKRRTFISITELPDKEDKAQKAQPWMSLMGQRQVRWPGFHPNYQSAKAEHLKFDNGASDDTVDACANLGRGLERVIKASAQREQPKEYATNTFGWIKAAAKREANDNRKVSVLRTG